MTNEPVKSATKKAIDIAKENNVLISFDPNYRPALWKNDNPVSYTHLDVYKRQTINIL